MANTIPVPLPVILSSDKDSKYQDEQTKLQEKSTDILEKVKNLLFGYMGGVTASDLLDNSKKSLQYQKTTSPQPKYKKLGEKITDWTGKLFQSKWFEKIGKGIGNIARSLGGGLLDLIMGLLLFAFIDPNGTLLTSLINLFANLLTWVINVLASLFPKIVTLFVKLVPVVLKALTKVIGAIVKLLPTIINAIIDLIPEIFKALIQLVPVLIDSIGLIFDSVFKALEQKFPWLKPLFDILRDIGSVVGGFVKSLFQGGQSFEMIKGVFIKLAEVFGELFPFISAFIGAIISDLGPLIQNLLPTLLEIFSALGSAFKEILPALKDLFDALTLLWTNAISPLIKILVMILVPIIKIVFKAIGMLARDIANFITDVINAINFIADNFQTIIESIGVAILTFLFPPIGIFIALGYLIYKNWEKIKKKVMPIIDKLLEIINAIGGAMKSLINTFLEWKKSISIEGLIKSIKEGFGKLLNKMFTNIPGLDQIRNFFEGFWNKIKDSSIVKFFTGTSGSENQAAINDPFIKNLKSLGVDEKKAKFVKDVLMTRGVTEGENFIKNNIENTKNQEELLALMGVIASNIKDKSKPLNEDALIKATQDSANKITEALNHNLNLKSSPNYTLPRTAKD